MGGELRWTDHQFKFTHIFSEFSGQELSQLGVENTVSDKLTLLANVVLSSRYRHRENKGWRADETLFRSGRAALQAAVTARAGAQCVL